MIIAQVKAAIRRHNLFQPGQHILVGVSGGADSIALLALLRDLAPAWKLRLTAAHLNHRIRGGEADQDARFVRAFAHRLGVGFIEGRLDIPRLARRRGISLEMAGRDARYAFFADAARRRQCDVVATAHTANDQSETILMKLARGAGSQGLAGIPYVTHRGTLNIVRPLRNISRDAILRLLRRRHLPWREDASNADSAYLRNRIRHEVLPLLEAKLNPRIRVALGRTAEILDKENEWMDSLAKDALSECTKKMPARTIDEHILAALPQAARRRVLRLWLVDNGLSPESLDFDAVDSLDKLLMGRQDKRSVNLPGGHVVRKKRQCLCLNGGAELIPEAFRIPLNIPGETLLPQLGLRIMASLAPGVSREKPRGIGHYPARASLALSAWRRRRICARSWQPGDRMAPFRLAGSKKVQDIFTDGKVARDLRHRAPLIECGGEILWIPGYRIARGWEIIDPAAPELQLAIERYPLAPDIV